MLNLVSRLGPISIAQRDDDSISEAGNVCLALKQDQPADSYALQRCDELQRRKKKRCWTLAECQILQQANEIHVLLIDGTCVNIRPFACIGTTVRIRTIVRLRTTVVCICQWVFTQTTVRMRAYSNDRLQTRMAIRIYAHLREHCGNGRPSVFLLRTIALQE